MYMCTRNATRITVCVSRRHSFVLLSLMPILPEYNASGSSFRACTQSKRLNTCFGRDHLSTEKETNIISSLAPLPRPPPPL